MKKLTLGNYNCKITIDEMNEKYLVHFVCNMDGEIYNTVSYEFRSPLDISSFNTPSEVFNIFDDASELELEFGIVNDRELIVFFSINDYNLDTSYYLGQKKYTLEINKNSSYFNEFKRIVEAIKIDKRYKGGKKDEYQSYSVKH